MSATLGIAELLEPHHGVVAVVGSGGKSTLLERGGRALASRGAHVALATSTHILPPHGIALVTSVEELDGTIARGGIAVIGKLDDATGKLSAPTCGIEALTGHADHVLVEADGAKRLPLKAHAGWEPVVPRHTVLTILVVGASGFGRPIKEAVHRPEVFCELVEASPTDMATPKLVARAIAAEKLVGPHDLVLVNQVEHGGAMRSARLFASELMRAREVTVFAGSLHQDRLFPVDR